MSKNSKPHSLQKNARKLTHFRKALSLGYERSNQCKTSVQNILDLIGDIPQNYTRCGVLNYNSFSKSFHSFKAEEMLFFEPFLTRNAERDILSNKIFDSQFVYGVLAVGDSNFQWHKKITKSARSEIASIVVRGSAS